MKKLLEFFSKIGESIKETVLEYQTNPIFWLILFFVGLGIFKLGYELLSKDK